MQNWEDTILSQYGNSPAVLAVIQSFNDAIDPSVDLDAFDANVWNINTAQGFGLDIWGRIVGVARVVVVPATGTYFGFEEGGTVNAGGFGQAPFYSGSLSTTNYSLSDTAYRLLILVKALSNISNCSVITYNRILMMLFPGRGNAHVSDTGAMLSRLTFEFLLEPFEIAILKHSGVLSNPTGVLFEIMDIGTTMFCFNEASGPLGGGFDHGTFFKGFE